MGKGTRIIEDGLEVAVGLGGYEKIDDKWQWAQECRNTGTEVTC